MHLFIAYLKFLLRSTNEHGVHSPFVFGLVTKCFYDKKKCPAYEILKRHRKTLLSNHDKIKVKDFGAGSRVFSSEERKISAIAKNAGISPKRARLLNRLVRYLQVDTALELGTSVGLGTAALATGNNVKITTLEGCPATAAVAKKYFEEFGLDNIELVIGEFDEILENRGQRPEAKVESEEWREEREKKYEGGSTKVEVGMEENSKSPFSDSKNLVQQPQTTNNKQQTPFDLIFIDGNHKKAPTLTYFEKLLSLVHNDSIMIFDDIHWSKEMEEAWEEIKAHPSVRVTIDTFFQGFVFFRREQAKEHFVIRI